MTNITPSENKSKKSRKRPTQADVALLAKVSTGTVSLVLNENSSRIPISEETRMRVLDAVRTIGYTPNPVAQMLAKGSNHLVGVFTYEPIFPYAETDFYYQYLVGVEHEATCCDYNVLLFTRGRNGTERKIFDRGRNTLTLADGSLLIGTHTDLRELRRLHDEGYPFVYIGRREVPGCQIDWVTSDYVTSSLEATRYLLDLGHRRFGFVFDNPEHESTIDRLAGCRSAITDQSSADVILIQTDQLNDVDEFRRIVTKNGITAIFTTSLLGADLLMPLVHQAGFSVPGDLSIIGLGDGYRITHTQLHLTQVKLNRQLVGAAAMRALLDRLEGKASSPQHILVPCELILGDTTSSSH